MKPPIARLIAIGSLAAAIVAVAAVEPAVAAKKKTAAAKARCAAGTLCTGPCNNAKWCNVQVCAASGRVTPTLGFCVEGSLLCPPRC